ncbi:hypothetical protein PQX77_011711 [Marasmius sp. AFHP31]|nr:hypothetical protein PQX77_011711 [Marasmius sp. AFHP31]
MALVAQESSEEPENERKRKRALEDNTDETGPTPKRVKMDSNAEPRERGGPISPPSSSPQAPVVHTGIGNTSSQQPLCEPSTPFDFRLPPALETRPPAVAPDFAQPALLETELLVERSPLDVASTAPLLEVNQQPLPSSSPDLFETEPLAERNGPLDIASTTSHPLEANQQPLPLSPSRLPRSATNAPPHISLSSSLESLSTHAHSQVPNSLPTVTVVEPLPMQVDTGSEATLTQPEHVVSSSALLDAPPPSPPGEMNSEPTLVEHFGGLPPLLHASPDAVNASAPLLPQTRTDSPNASVLSVHPGADELGRGDDLGVPVSFVEEPEQDAGDYDEDTEKVLLKDRDADMANTFSDSKENDADSESSDQEDDDSSDDDSTPTPEPAGTRFHSRSSRLSSGSSYSSRGSNRPSSRTSPPRVIASRCNVQVEKDHESSSTSGDSSTTSTSDSSTSSAGDLSMSSARNPSASRSSVHGKNNRGHSTCTNMSCDESLDGKTTHHQFRADLSSTSSSSKQPKTQSASGDSSMASASHSSASSTSDSSSSSGSGSSTSNASDLSMSSARNFPTSRPSEGNNRGHSACTDMSCDESLDGKTTRHQFRADLSSTSSRPKQPKTQLASGDSSMASASHSSASSTSDSSSSSGSSSSTSSSGGSSTSSASDLSMSSVRNSPTSRPSEGNNRGHSTCTDMSCDESLDGKTTHHQFRTDLSSTSSSSKQARTRPWADSDDAMDGGSKPSTRTPTQPFWAEDTDDAMDGGSNIPNPPKQQPFWADDSDTTDGSKPQPSPKARKQAKGIQPLVQSDNDSHGQAQDHKPTADKGKRAEKPREKGNKKSRTGSDRDDEEMDSENRAAFEKELFDLLAQVRSDTKRKEILAALKNEDTDLFALIGVLYAYLGKLPPQKSSQAPVPPSQAPKTSKGTYDKDGFRRVKRRPQASLDLGRLVREEIRRLLQPDGAPLSSLLQSQRVEWQKHKIGGPAIGRFVLDLASPHPWKDNLWNQRAADVFALHFVKLEGFAQFKRVDVVNAFRKHLRPLRDKFLQQAPTSNHPEVHLTERRDMRRRTHCDRRVGALRLVAGWCGAMKKFLEPAKLFTPGMMSGEETDTEGSTPKMKVLIALVQRWRAAGLTDFMLNLDALHIASRYLNNGKYSRGQFPSVRRRSKKLDLVYQDPPAGLPINWYDSAWLDEDPKRRESLKPGPPVPLRLPDEILRLAKRFRHVQVRTDLPLAPNEVSLD